LIVADEPTTPALLIERNVLISTWFHVGGGADRLARPTNAEQLSECLRIDPSLRVLGDGANLLVDDDGVDSLVVTLADGDFSAVRIDDDHRDDFVLVTVGAGVNLPKLINQTVRLGLAGLETLGGIPASIGGALVMNAGGAFGQIADVVERVFAMRRDGTLTNLTRDQIAFGYRHSGLNDLIVTSAELRLARAGASQLRQKHLDVMAYKKRTQPMADNSAGCAFKNPTLSADIAGDGGQEPIGAKGQRVSAGMLIDRARCKGLRIRTASVSDRHGNFLTADTGGKARDVIELIGEVRRRVYERFGVELHTEVVIWTRTGQDTAAKAQVHNP